MNIIWTVLTAASLVILTIKNPQTVLSVCVESGAQALSVSLGLCGVYCLWMGLFQVAENCRLVESLSHIFAPVNKFLYKTISPRVAEQVSLNLASNLLGIGNAATPSAVAAIRETEHSERLSFAGTMLFVINASGVQLMPTTVMGMRAQLGSADPADILLPNLLTTAVTAAVGIILVFILCGKKTHKFHSSCRSNARKKSDLMP